MDKAMFNTASLCTSTFNKARRSPSQEYKSSDIIPLTCPSFSHPTSAKTITPKQTPFANKSFTRQLNIRHKHSKSSSNMYIPLIVRDSGTPLSKEQKSANNIAILILVGGGITIFVACIAVCCIKSKKKAPKKANAPQHSGWYKKHWYS